MERLWMLSGSIVVAGIRFELMVHSVTAVEIMQVKPPAVVNAGHRSNQVGTGHEPFVAGSSTSRLMAMVLLIEHRRLHLPLRIRLRTNSSCPQVPSATITSAVSCKTFMVRFKTTEFLAVVKAPSSKRRYTYQECCHLLS